MTVESAEVFKDGTLKVAFSDGSRLSVASDPDYEAWEFAGNPRRQSRGLARW
ncbi:MAG: DUF6188 family protein [Thermomicrobiales bacterium]